MHEFEIKVREIFTYIGEYAVKQLKIDTSIHPTDMSNEQKEKFIKLCHEGARIGQNLILEELLFIVKSRTEINDELKKAGSDKKKELKAELDALKYNEAILRSFMDFLFWNVLGNQGWKARRFYSGNRNRPSLNASNLSSLRRTVQHLHDAEPDSLALISDLTSFVDIGDIIHIKKGGYDVIEVKEGILNKKILNFFHDKSDTSIEDQIKLILANGENPKHILKQMDRMLKQMEKAIKSKKLLEDEKGEDPFLKNNVQIIESEAPINDYFDDMLQLFEEVNNKNWSYRIIDGVLMIGMYKDKFSSAGNMLISELSHHIFGKKYPIFHYAHQIYMPIKEPIFYKPFGKEVLFDILFQRIKIYLCLNLDGFIKMFNESGIKAQWLSRKKTHEYLDKGLPAPFRFDNKAITIAVNGKEIVLGDIFLSRIIYDNVKPSSIIEMYKHLKK